MATKRSAGAETRSNTADHRASTISEGFTTFTIDQTSMVETNSYESGIDPAPTISRPS